MSSLLRLWRRSGPDAPGTAGLPSPDTSLHPVGGVSAQRGENQMRLLRHWGLEPTSRVLEIGCGVGRLAYELAAFLDAGGRYSGFDISPRTIGWLNEHYAPRLPNFRFDLVDVRNVRYRPGSDVAATDFAFPYADDQFDVACAFAVFMHMQLPEIGNYLREIRRVLKPDGFGVATFRAVAAGEQPKRTRDREWVAVGDGVYTIFPETPGRALAYDDTLVRATIEAAGLEIARAITGKWHGRPTSGDEPALGADAYVVKRRPA